MAHKQYKIYEFEKRWFSSLYQRGIIQQHEYIMSIKNLGDDLRTWTGRKYYVNIRLGQALKHLCPNILKYKDGKETFYVFPRNFEMTKGNQS